MRPLPALASGCPGSVFVIERGSFLDKMAVPATQQPQVSPNGSGHCTGCLPYDFLSEMLQYRQGYRAVSSGSTGSLLTCLEIRSSGERRLAAHFCLGEDEQVGILCLHVLLEA
jgi:hypothetical protein